MEVGAKIRDYIIEHGITQVWLSSKTNIAPAKLNLILNCKRKLSFAEYEVICWALNVEVSHFLEARPPTDRAVS